MAAKRDDGEEVLTPRQAAEFLTLESDTLRHWRTRGGGPVFVKLSKRSVGYLRSDLIAYVRANRVDPAA
jgi:hypothetical protein